MFESNGEQREMSLLQWQYMSHLAGAQVCIAHTDRGLLEQPAALYTAFPVRFRHANRVGTSFQSFDTLTVSRYRGKALFVRLADHLYKRIARQGADLVFGIPNSSSVGGFTRYLDWTILDSFPILFRPVGLRYVRTRVRIRTPRITHHEIKQLHKIREVGCPSLGSTELFNRSLASEGMGVIRDFDYLSWRLARPGSSYRILESVGPDNQLTGMIVFEILQKHGCSMGYVMDLMVDRQHEAHADVLLETAIRTMRDCGADMILAWALPTFARHTDFTRHGFHHLPSRLSPVKLHLGYRSLSTQTQVDSRTWNFSYLDSDTV